MKIKSIARLILFILFIIGCDYYDDRLVINNKSNMNIYVRESLDTVFALGENRSFMIGDVINAYNKRKIFFPGSIRAWEDFIYQSLNKQLHIFILSEDTLKKYDAKTIEKMQKYEKRIDIGIDELKAKNWEIVYEGK